MRYEDKDCHDKNTADGVGRESSGMKWMNKDGNGCPIAVRQGFSRRLFVQTESRIANLFADYAEVQPKMDEVNGLT